MDAHYPHRGGGAARSGRAPRRHGDGRLDDKRAVRGTHLRADLRGHHAAWGSEGWRNGIAGNLGGAALLAHRGQVRDGSARPAPQDRGSGDDGRPSRGLDGCLTRISGCASGTACAPCRTAAPRRTDRAPGTAIRTACSRCATRPRSTPRSTGSARRATRTTRRPTGIRRATCAACRAATGSGHAAGRPTRPGHVAAALSRKEV